MARYRKIDVRMWGDSKFKSLSRPKPNAQSLWQYLLTGPFTTNIPGIIPFGEAAISEGIEWNLRDFRRALCEIQRHDMIKVDHTARIMWIQKAISYNPPESPNVVKSWAVAWDEIPECSLKVEIYQHIKSFLEGLGEGFGKAFSERCCEPKTSKGLGEGFGEGLPKDYGESRTGTGTGTGTIPPIPPRGDFDAFYSEYPRKVGKEAAKKVWGKLDFSNGLFEKIATGLRLAKESEQWQRDDGKFIPHPATWLNGKRWEDEHGHMLAQKELPRPYVEPSGPRPNFAAELAASLARKMEMESKDKK
jgi:hypothetical protein